MQDVADLVGVSRQTVSAVINGKPGITEPTKERVLAAIAELGYRPDLTARSLRTRRTHTIALMLTDVSSPVAGRMAVAAESHAYQMHYNLVLYNTCDDVQRERFYMNSILQRSVDGVLYISARDESSVPALLQEAGIPVVVIDRTPLSYSGPCVVLDNFEAGRTAGEHLVSLGHRRIAHVGGPSFVHISDERLAGLQSALQPLGDLVELALVRSANWRIESGHSAMTSLLGRGSAFTAVFAAGDLLAIGAMRALREAGKCIPDQVSVIGLDDIDIAPYLEPPLTTVSQSIATMAETGMRMLLDIVHGESPPQTQIILPPQIAVRGSTQALSSEGQHPE
jgi:LacI family transcriptional regulator